MPEFDAKADTPVTSVASGDRFPFGDVSADGWATIEAAALLAALVAVRPDAGGDGTLFLNGAGGFTAPPGGGGGGGAPTDATYLTLGTNGTLSKERVLTEGTGIDFVDAGAGSTLTVRIDPTYAGQNTITTLGTVATGVWKGTAVATGYGGLGADNSAATGVPVFAAGTCAVTAATGTGAPVLATSPTVRDVLYLWPTGKGSGLEIYVDASGTYGQAFFLSGGGTAVFDSLSSTGALALNAGAVPPAAMLDLTPAANTLAGFRFTGASGQTALPIDVRAYGGTTVFSVSAAGAATAASVNGVTVANGGSGALTVTGTASVSGANTGDQSTFGTIAVSGQSDVVADAANDTLTFVAGSGISITTNAATDTVTIAATGGGGSGAPTGASYVVLGTDVDLTAERVLTAGTAIGLTDGGAGSTLTVAVNDAELVALAGLTSAADRLPYFTGSGTAALATFTAAGRALVDDADAAAQRATLGLGSIATQAANAVAITGGGISDTELRLDLAAPGSPVDGNVWAEDNVCRALLDGQNTALLSAYNNLSELATYGVAATARTNLGATTAGANLFTLANPSAVTFLRLNADNTVTARSAANFRTDLGLGTGDTVAFANLSGTNTGDQTSVTGNAGTATALQTARAIYGNNFDGTAALTQVIASTYGGTGNGFTKFTGPATAERTFTLPNASATVLTDNAAVTVAQGGTGGTTAAAARSGIGFVTLTTTATSGTVTLDCAADNPTFVLSLTGNVTLALSNEADGRRFTLFVRGQASGYTLGYWSGLKWAGGAAPTLPTTSGRVLPISFIRLAAGEWLGIPGTECY